MKPQNLSSRPPSSARGFSLLELMIVLVVIVGLLALAWPNLQRPLKRAELSQATQQLREVIDESRYQAIAKGQPVFIRLKQGDSEVVAGGFESFASTDSPTTSESLENNLRPSGSFLPSNESRDPATVVPKVWKLPENIVISDVVWSDSLEYQTAEESSSDSSTSDASATGLYGSKNDQDFKSWDNDGSGRADIEQMPDSFDLRGEAEQVWWLPVSSLHQGRDVEITLWDKNSHESMRVSLSSATGELEIHR
jgi:prepilin-type N-terminal cleavage/methylation domain-containing protein